VSSIHAKEITADARLTTFYMTPAPKLLVAIALIAGAFILRIVLLARDAPFANAEPIHSVTVLVQDDRQLAPSRDTLTNSQRDGFATILGRSGWRRSDTQFNTGDLTVALYGPTQTLGTIYIATNAIVAVDRSGKAPIKRSLTAEEYEFLVRTLRRLPREQGTR
jgi:hypothetical protein